MECAFHKPPLALFRLWDHIWMKPAGLLLSKHNSITTLSPFALLRRLKVLWLLQNSTVYTIAHFIFGKKPTVDIEPSIFSTLSGPLS